MPEIKKDLKQEKQIMKNTSVKARLKLLFTFLTILSSIVSAGLSPIELKIAADALDESNIYERKHIILVWPETLTVDWYFESNVQGPEQLADWLEQSYTLCTDWFKINPNELINKGKSPRKQARLILIHNGMRDYNIGGELPRPVIGLRDLQGVGSEDWFGWLTHEIAHEFFCQLPELVNNSENNTWHEALCDYMRYWLLKETGMPKASLNWRKVLQSASRDDKYKGGAEIIMSFHEQKSYKSPADLLDLIKAGKITSCFGDAPWDINEHAVTTAKNTKITFEGVIDGAGSFTFRDDKIFYEHFTYEYPSMVKINGKTWPDLNTPFELGFIPNFKSVHDVKRSGRNIMALIQHQDKLVLFFDDFENASSLYRITFAISPMPTVLKEDH